MTENIQIDLRRGFRHEIVMKQQLVRSLKAPYESNCVDYNEMGYQVSFHREIPAFFISALSDSGRGDREPVRN